MPERNGMGKLRLAGEKKYSLAESGLNKIVFGRQRAILLDTLGGEFPIGDLALKLDTYGLNQQTGEEEYFHLECSVYLLKGVFEKSRAAIGGVIRPVIYNRGVVPRVLNNIPPEFHFYLENFKINGIECPRMGRSLGLKGKMLKAEITPSGKRNLKNMGPLFRLICLDPAKTEKIYFKAY